MAQRTLSSRTRSWRAEELADDAVYGGDEVIALVIECYDHEPESEEYGELVLLTGPDAAGYDDDATAWNERNGWTESHELHRAEREAVQ